MRHGSDSRHRQFSQASVWLLVIVKQASDVPIFYHLKNEWGHLIVTQKDEHILCTYSSKTVSGLFYIQSNLLFV
jgi:hypothetical protein